MVFHKLPTFALVAGLVAASPTYAGSIEVKVSHRDGWPIVDQTIVLKPLSAFREATRSGWVPRPFSNIETTDDGGRVTFVGLSPGTHSVGVFGHLREPLLVKPKDNPLAPVPIVTLDADSAHRQIEVEMWTGTLVQIEVVDPDGVPLEGFHAAFHHPETGVDIATWSVSTPFLERRLLPSTWEVTVKPKRGFEWVSLELGDARLDSDTARLDLDQKPLENSLRWTFKASEASLPDGEDLEGGRSEDAPEDAPLTIQVLAARSWRPTFTVEIHSLAQPGEPVHSTTVSGRSAAAITDLPPGDYLVVAGGRSCLEGRTELRGFDGDAAPRTVEVVIPTGAEIRLQALDPKDRPVLDLEVEIERLEDDPEIVLRDDAFREAKWRRTGSTRSAGWFEAVGFYPGRYLVRTRLRRERAADAQILLGLAGGELSHATEFEIELNDGPVEIEARVSGTRPSEF